MPYRLHGSIVFSETDGAVYPKSFLHTKAYYHSHPVSRFHRILGQGGGVKNCIRGFPGSAVVENLPAIAGDTSSSRGLGRSHMPRSKWAREPPLLSLRVWSLCSATRGRDSERPAHRNEEWPPLATTRESPSTETKTRHTQK